MDKIVYIDDNYPIGIYLDKNHKRPLSTGKYGIIFNNISDNAWSFSKKELNGYIDDEPVDFDPFIKICEKLGLIRILNELKEKNYQFANGGYGYGYLYITEEEANIFKNNGFENNITDINNKYSLNLYDMVSYPEHAVDGNYYDVEVVNGKILKINGYSYISHNWIGFSEEYIIEDYKTEDIVDILNIMTSIDSPFISCDIDNDFFDNLTENNYFYFKQTKTNNKFIKITVLDIINLKFLFSVNISEGHYSYQYQKEFTTKNELNKCIDEVVDELEDGIFNDYCQLILEFDDLDIFD